MVELVAVARVHVEELAANLRAADRAELVACGRRDPLAVIARGVALSTHRATALVDGRVVAIFGVVPRCMSTGAGIPWMLGTDLVVTHRRALMKLSPAYIDAMLRPYPYLENVVHADNALAVRWLRRAGFFLHPATPHPVTGALFHRFEMKAGHV